MKRLLLAPLCIASTLFGQECCEEALPPCFYPFNITGAFLNVVPTEFTTTEVEGQKLHYQQEDLTMTCTYPFSEIWGLIFGGGYLGSLVSWDENPFFSESHFGYVSLTGGAFTKSFPDWEWSTFVSLLVDTAKLDLGHYALYQWTIWGKYALCEPIILHFGYFLEVGLNKDQIWPIIGFEYIPPEGCWGIHAVYPVNIAAEYYVTETWTAAVALRFLRNRHRVKENDPLPQGIFEYRVWGAEFDLSYDPVDWFGIKGYVGSTFPGNLKITNRNNHHAQYFKFESSFYAGGTATFNF